MQRSSSLGGLQQQQQSYQNGNNEKLQVPVIDSSRNFHSNSRVQLGDGANCDNQGND